ncbi:hypothetical protein HELRODRAFT_176791 [Helobdella robusta]|uniref:Uncharacterized protein n=1 Tax=Helobdella robusta TaxID=6412 RepID=T1FAX0_HELRO|nr:hypothetical protein HELRODRAFT_176791 [Helobdella robusta]ESN99622.1 hypothetical protein HELRODRAFT_176791 [Helobdella robusta]
MKQKVTSSNARLSRTKASSASTKTAVAATAADVVAAATTANKNGATCPDCLMILVKLANDEKDVSTKVAKCKLRECMKMFNEYAKNDHSNRSDNNYYYAAATTAAADVDDAAGVAAAAADTDDVDCVAACKSSDGSDRKGNCTSSSSSSSSLPLPKASGVMAPPCKTSHSNSKDDQMSRPHAVKMSQKNSNLNDTKTQQLQPQQRQQHKKSQKCCIYNDARQQQQQEPPPLIQEQQQQLPQDQLQQTPQQQPQEQQEIEPPQQPQNKESQPLPQKHRHRHHGHQQHQQQPYKHNQNKLDDKKICEILLKEKLKKLLQDESCRHEMALPKNNDLDGVVDDQVCRTRSNIKKKLMMMKMRMKKKKLMMMKMRMKKKKLMMMKMRMKKKKLMMMKMSECFNDDYAGKVNDLLANSVETSVGAPTPELMKRLQKYLIYVYDVSLKFNFTVGMLACRCVIIDADIVNDDDDDDDDGDERNMTDPLIRNDSSTCCGAAGRQPTMYEVSRKCRMLTKPQPFQYLSQFSKQPQPRQLQHPRPKQRKQQSRMQKFNCLNHRPKICLPDKKVLDNYCKHQKKIDIKLKDIKKDTEIKAMRASKQDQLHWREMERDEKINKIRKDRRLNQLRRHQLAAAVKERSREERRMVDLCRSAEMDRKEREKDERMKRKEMKTAQAKKQADQIECIENYYRNQYAILLEEMDKRKNSPSNKIQQDKLLREMKQELRRDVECQMYQQEEKFLRNSRRAHSSENKEKPRHYHTHHHRTKASIAAGVSSSDAVAATLDCGGKCRTTNRHVLDRESYHYNYNTNYNNNKNTQNGHWKSQCLPHLGCWCIHKP